MNRNELLSRAGALIDRCHCPYSGFRVAAVLEDCSGGLHDGVNIENASLGLSICAERVALASAVAAGVREFRRMLVHSPDGSPMPCGACRQVLSEFCGMDFEVLISDGSGETACHRLGDLLPLGFNLQSVPLQNPPYGSPQ